MSSFIVYSDGSCDDEKAVILPSKTTSFNDIAYLTIRAVCEFQVGRGNILLDFQIPTMFLKSSMWTFKVDARLGDLDNTCLFGRALTQWLDEKRDLLLLL